MKIKTILTLNISVQNQNLVPYIATKYTKEKKIIQETVDGTTEETIQETMRETIVRVTQDAVRQAQTLLIVPYLERYFGEKDKAMFDALVLELENGGIEVETTIE